MARPADTGAAGRCRVHRRRDRVATCGACGSALCVDCVVHTAVGIKCRNCTGGSAATAPTAAKAAKVDRRAGPATPSASSGGGDRRRWAIPLAAAGLVVLLVAGLGLLGGGDGSDRPSAEEGNTETVVDRIADFTGAGGLNIGATLTIPAGVGATKAPGVLIVPGGATVDRNHLLARDRQNDPFYQDVANSLAQAGIVSLRYDLRGTGASKLAEGQGKSFEDLVTDAKSGLDFLALRRETQGAPLAVLGYDNGGFVAMSLAAADTRIKKVVLVSTPGRPLVDLLAEDFRKEVPDQAEGEALAQAVRAAAAEVANTGQVPRAETLPPALRGIFTPSEGPYLRGLFGFEPAAEARRVQVPTLVVRGGTDTSITDVDVQQLTSNLARAEQLVPPLAGNALGLPAGQEGPMHDPTQHGSVRDPAALNGINDWLKRQFA